MSINHFTVRRISAMLVLLFAFSLLCAQSTSVTISGMVLDKTDQTVLPYTNVVLNAAQDSAFVTGTITEEDGRFKLVNVKPGNYILSISFLGYQRIQQPLFVGSLSGFLDVATIELEPSGTTIGDVVIAEKRDEVNGKMAKKSFNIDDNISQTGGSVLQAMQNLPGVTVEDGKVQLRGNDRVAVLIDGKQTALTGFGNQSGLDNIPASNIERIEIINNPSAKFDANGNGGIINIIYKKNKKEGLTGKIGLAGGLGALWERQENLPSIRPQYSKTPKINPSLSLNYRKGKLNAFASADYLYTETLNKNEFVTRYYDDGTIINQQSKRNRNTGFLTTKAGFDYQLSDQNMFTVSGLFGLEKIIDNGDEPFFNEDLTDRLRLWQFLEDELKTTVVASATFQHKFKQPGHKFDIGFNYTYHRENEKYFFDNILPTFEGEDAFKLISDENVADLNFDYTKPLKYGRIEGGLKYRYRIIPTDMLFIPGFNSPLDTNAGGAATYKENIPAVYGNYVYENRKVEAEIGLRVEYVGLTYDVNANHNTYETGGYDYAQPFPNVRLAYKFNDRNKISLFFNRRVDRPNEVDIRIFPKYDDAEIIKVGNPNLQPQFTNSLELGYKTSWKGGYFYSAAYHKFANGTITRISSTVPGSNLIYAVFQNAGKSYNTGLEAIFSQDVSQAFSFNLNVNAYRNQIDSFTVVSLYPVEHTFSAAQQEVYSGNAKLNLDFHFANNWDLKVSGIYLAPDIIPQGTIDARFSINAGVKKTIQKGKGEVFANANDLFNTLVISKRIQGEGFYYTSQNFNETQVVRLGYSYKF